MPYLEPWSRSQVEELVKISVVLSDGTQTLESCRRIPGALGKLLGLERISLAIIGEERPGDKEVVLLSSWGTHGAPVVSAEELLEIQRQAAGQIKSGLPTFRQMRCESGSDESFSEVAASEMMMVPRGLVFAREISATHQLLLIIHRELDQDRPGEQVMDTLAMIACHLAKLMGFMTECTDLRELLGMPFDRLTDREWAVLRCLTSAEGEKQLAAKLGLSPHTLHSHIKAIYRKVGVQGRLALVLRLEEAQRQLRGQGTSAAFGFAEARPMECETVAG